MNSCIGVICCITNINKLLYQSELLYINTKRISETVVYITDTYFENSRYV